jgi:hypothetical protein
VDVFGEDRAVMKVNKHADAARVLFNIWGIRWCIRDRIETVARRMGCFLEVTSRLERL